MKVPYWLKRLSFEPPFRIAVRAMLRWFPVSVEFNEKNSCVKIDKWYGISANRPFPERPFLDKMFVAHDLAGISDVSLDHDGVSLPLTR